MRKIVINKIVSFVLLVSFSLSLVLPVNTALGVEIDRTNISENSNAEKSVDINKSMAKSQKPKRDDVIDKLSDIDVPFIPNEGQIDNDNVAYSANIFAGDVHITRDGEIIYNFSRYEEISKKEYQAELAKERALQQKKPEQAAENMQELEDLIETEQEDDEQTDDNLNDNDEHMAAAAETSIVVDNNVEVDENDEKSIEEEIEEQIAAEDMQELENVTETEQEDEEQTDENLNDNDEHMVVEAETSTVADNTGNPEEEGYPEEIETIEEAVKEEITEETVQNTESTNINSCISKNVIVKNVREDSKDHKAQFHTERQVQYEKKQVHKIKEKLVNSNKLTVIGDEKAITKVNYFNGKDQRDWHTNLATYKNIKMGEVYPGIELTLKAVGSSVEKVFTVNPGGNVEDIKISLEGAEQIYIDEKGQLAASADESPFSFSAPVAYQKINGRIINVPVAYWVQGNTYGFNVGEYDETKPLIIDPLLNATFYGENSFLFGIDIDSQGNVFVAGYVNNYLTISKFDSDLSNLLAYTSIDIGYMLYNYVNALITLRVDRNNNVYVTGGTFMPTFPTTPGAYCTELRGIDVFITKFNSDLDTILASTFLGGSDDSLIEMGCYLEVDSSGNIYVAGETDSSDFPTTTGAYDTTGNGKEDIFISKFSPDLTTLQASTLLGTSECDSFFALLLDEEGNVYVAGITEGEIPTTEGAYRTTRQEGMLQQGLISKFNSSLDTLLASTYTDRSVNDMAFDKEGEIWVSAFNLVQKYNKTLSARSNSKALELYDYFDPDIHISIYALITDNNGKIYALGEHGIAEMDSEQYLGNSYGFNEASIRYAFVNDQGDIYLCGDAQSDQFIVTEDAYDTTYNSGRKGFISRINLGYADSLEFSLGNPSWGGVVGQNINICNGNFFFKQTDLSLSTRSLPLHFTRCYNSRSEINDIMGKGWQHNYNTKLIPNQDNSITILYGDGHQATFQLAGSNYVPNPGCWEKLENNGDGTYTLTFKDQTKYKYDTNGKLIQITDKNNNQTTLQYTAGLLTTVTCPAGQTLQFTYKADNRLIKVLDSANRFIEFTYDSTGNLVTFKDLNGEITAYTYDSLGLTTITDPKNNIVLTNTYDNEARVTQQKDAQNNLISVTYNANTRQNTYTDALNNSSTYTHDLDYRIRKVELNTDETAIFEYDWRYCLVNVKDFNGNLITREYDRRGNLYAKNVQNQPGYERWTYDQYNNVTSYKDALQKITTYTYDNNSNLISTSRIVSDQTEETAYQYDQYGQVTQYTDAENNITAMTYDPRGNLLTVTDPENKTTTYTYDLAGRILTQTDSHNGVRTYTYDQIGNLLTAKDPLNYAITYTYDPCGNLSSITDQRNNTTTYTYDENNNLTQVTDPLNHSTVFTYDANGNNKSITDALDQTITYNYDHRDRLISTTDDANNTETYTLDGNGNIIAKTDSRNNTVQYQYDFKNRLIKITDPLNNVYSCTYDRKGNKISDTNSLEHQTQYTYDEASQLLTVTDPLNNSNSHTYDKNGQILTTNDAENNSTAYTYDGSGRIKTVTDALNNTTAYTYDGNGNLTKTTDARGIERILGYDALNRLITETIANKTTTRAYDPAGNLLSVTTPKGQTIAYEYDANNRLTKKSYPDMTEVTYTYNDLDQRTAMTDPAGTTTYTYDNLGRLKTLTRAGSTTTYDYDTESNITGITYPDGLHLTYTYNELNLPHTVTDGINTHSIIYDQAAQPSLETMPNGVNVNYTFDPCGRLTLLENKLNQSILTKSAYTYDQNDNRLSLTNQDNQTTAYTYDPLNQLTAVNNSVIGNIEYTYDEIGNRKNMDESIDNAKANDYLYDFEDRIIQTQNDNETITYTYDGDGTLIKKTITTGATTETYQYLYDYTAGLPRLLVEKKNDGTTYDYLYAGGRLYGRKGPEGTVYYHQDGLGSTIAITDASGNILNKYDYAPFGEPQIIQETVENSLLFTGEPYDQSELLYLRARYYDPKTGRFVSKDKYKGEVTDPSSQNSYAYCGNNPVNYVDPSGNYIQLPITYITALGTSPDTSRDMMMLSESGAAFVENPNFWTGLAAGLDAGALIVPGVSAGGSKIAKGAKQTVSKVKDFFKGAGEATEDVIQITKDGVALPKGRNIPSDLIENPYRSGSYGRINPNTGKFEEILRIDPATLKGKKGPNYSHYHLNKGDEHFSPRPGDKDPWFEK